MKNRSKIYGFVFRMCIMTEMLVNEVVEDSVRYRLCGIRNPETASILTNRNKQLCNCIVSLPLFVFLVRVPMYLILLFENRDQSNLVQQSHIYFYFLFNY